MRSPRVSSLLALAAGLALGAGGALLVPGEDFRGLEAVRTWRNGEVSHLYRFPVAAGEFVRIAAEQRSSDVILEVLEPGDREPTLIDGYTYATGTDAFELVAAKAVQVRVRILLDHAIGDAPGYRLAISAPHPASVGERARAAAFAEFEQANDLPGEESIRVLERALRRVEPARSDDLPARIHDRLGRRLPKDDSAALRHFRAAAVLAEEPRLKTAALHKLGNVLLDRKRLDEAGAAYQAEYQLSRRIRDRIREAYALEGFSELARRRGRFEEALLRASQAYVLWRGLGDRTRQARTPETLGILSWHIGDAEQAAVRFQAGLALDPYPDQKIDLLDELTGRRLRADLVVLSACDTALGKETRGEGPESLGRAFLAAGAANALVSLWRVDDSSTEALMVEFYRRLLKQRQAPASALRGAQLAVRSRGEWRDPYYWGAFVLQGE